MRQSPVRRELVTGKQNRAGQPRGGRTHRSPLPHGGWEARPAAPPAWGSGRLRSGAGGGRAAAAAKPLRAGAGMSLPGGAAAGCALRRGG